MSSGGDPDLVVRTLIPSVYLLCAFSTPHQKKCAEFRQLIALSLIPDIKEFRDNYKNLLGNLDCLILDCLREERSHVTHIILPESIEIVRELKPKKCYFTHMCHNIHYKKDAVKLDPWMDFAYDGLKVEIKSIF